MKIIYDYIDNILCVSRPALVESGILSATKYKNLVRYRPHIRKRMGKGNNNPAMLTFDLLDEDIKSRLRTEFGDPHKTTKQTAFTDFLEIDSEAVKFFDTYTFDNDKALPEKTKKEYVANASVLNAIHKIVMTRTGRAKALGKNTKNLWENMSTIIQELPQHTFPHSLPKNVRRLREKAKNYKAESYESLIHANFNNKSAEKLNEAAQMWAVSRWANQVNKCATITQLFHEYNARAEQENWKVLKKEKTVRNFLYREDIKPLWYSHRYGSKAYKEKYAYQLSTKMPTLRDSLWYGDGTKLNLFFLDENSKVSTVQVYEVMDAYSEVFLGYHISKTEDFEAQYFAYRMAVKTAGHRPYERVADNQGGHNKLENAGFLDKLSRLSVRTQPYNGKSKTIESAFGRFQQQILAKYPGFTGQNITTKKQESKANMEFILANKENLYTYDEMVAAYIEARMEWNNAPHYATGVPRNQMYRESNNPQAPEITMFEMVDLFWIQREKPVMYSAYGLTFTHKGVKYTYDKKRADGMPDMDWHTKNIDKKFVIKFDPVDMDMIYIYTQDALGLRFETELTTKVEIHRGKQEQETGEMEYIQNVLQERKDKQVEVQDAAQEILHEHEATAEQQGYNTPKPLGATRKTKKKPIKKRKAVPMTDYDKVVSNFTPVDEKEYINYYAQY
ncbi:MAG: kinase [Bacteroidales bacterium]|nr:kinase [Bacteroidales bacterium]